jgi:hypothetical protein
LLFYLRDDFAMNSYIGIGRLCVTSVHVNAQAEAVRDIDLTMLVSSLAFLASSTLALIWLKHWNALVVCGLTVALTNVVLTFARR